MHNINVFEEEEEDSTFSSGSNDWFQDYLEEIKNFKRPQDHKFAGEIRKNATGKEYMFNLTVHYAFASDLAVDMAKTELVSIYAGGDKAKFNKEYTILSMKKL